MRLGRYMIIVAILCFFVLPLMAKEEVDADQKTRKAAEAILDNILEGFRLDDYLKYARDFEDSLTAEGARNKFFEVNRYLQKTLGNYKSRKYLGVLNKKDAIIILWKAVYDKSKDDILIKLMLSKKNKRYVVTGLLLQ